MSSSTTLRFPSRAQTNHCYNGDLNRYPRMKHLLLLLLLLALIHLAVPANAHPDTLLTLWSEPHYKGTAQHFTEPVLHRILAGELQDHVGSLELAAGYVAVFSEVDEGGNGPFFTVAGPAREADLTYKIEGMPARRFVSITREEPEEGE